MAVPALKLNLAPPSNLWRLNHGVLGWSALAAGSLVLAGSLALTWRAYHESAAASRKAIVMAAQTSSVANNQRKVLAELRDVDVAKELPKWRLAERIFTERSLPWSRLTAELERSLVQDVRVKSVQRTRSADMKVQVKIKGEARTREAEAKFMEALQRNTFFEQVILEREGERQGGGVDFDYTLAASSTPPAYVSLPKYGPKTAAPRVAAPAPRVAAPAPRAAARPTPHPYIPPPTPRTKPAFSGLPTAPVLTRTPGEPTGPAPMPMPTGPSDRSNRKRIQQNPQSPELRGLPATGRPAPQEDQQ